MVAVLSAILQTPLNAKSNTQLNYLLKKKNGSKQKTIQSKFTLEDKKVPITKSFTIFGCLFLNCCSIFNADIATN